MAYCSVSLAGIGKDCGHSKGGIRKVYIANFKDNIYTVDEETGVITGVSLGSGTSDKFYEYSFAKGTGSVTNTLNVDAANGVNYVSTVIALQFNKQNAAKRMEVSALSVGDLSIVYEDANGEYFALGVEEPVVATEGSGQTGQSRTDGNFYSISLTDEQDSYPLPLSAAAITQLKALVAS